MPTSRQEELRKKVKKTIEQLRLWIQNDGGDMELVDVDCKKKSISIKITGACIDCEFFDQTFDQGIKQSLIKSHPEVEHVHFIRHSDLDDELSTAPKSKLKK